MGGDFYAHKVESSSPVVDVVKHFWWKSRFPEFKKLNNR